MKKFNTQAHIHSLDGALDEVTVICKETLFGHEVNNSYIVDYKGTLCTAIFNCIRCQYYVDDLYGKISSNDENYSLAIRSI